MTQSVVIYDSFYVSKDWAEELESTIHFVLDKLLDQLEDDDASETAKMPTPSGEPFDGCETCLRRETMVMTIAATLDAVHQGLAEPVRLAS